MQSTLKQRVEELMKDVKIELPNEFATYIGMKRAQLLYDVLKGDVKNSQTLVNFITKKFNKTNPLWISKGIYPKDIIDNKEDELERLKKENEALKRENELLKTIEALRKKIGD
jgi:uncharacterized FAD-dependent dehydrogenase